MEWLGGLETDGRRSRCLMGSCWLHPCGWDYLDKSPERDRLLAVVLYTHLHVIPTHLFLKAIILLVHRWGCFVFVFLNLAFNFRISSCEWFLFVNIFSNTTVRSFKRNWRIANRHIKLCKTDATQKQAQQPCSWNQSNSVLQLPIDGANNAANESSESVIANLPSAAYSQLNYFRSLCISLVVTS